MNRAKANFISAADAFDRWRDDVLTGKPPTLYRAGSGELERFEIGPGLVTLIGGAPGQGKTAFTMQLVTDALRLNPELRAVICNVEMPPGVLLDRQLARLSGIRLDLIRFRKLMAEHAHFIDMSMNTLEAMAERLCFVRAPFDLINVAATADAFGSHLIVLDYIQRIAPGDSGASYDRRGSVDATMNYLRQFADNGIAVIVVSAVARSKDKAGRASYGGDHLNLASFRESSELEFGCDDAFILTADGEDDETLVRIKHLKSRNGEAKDLILSFRRDVQKFEDAPAAKSEPITNHSKTRTTLRTLWDRTKPAGEDADE